MCFDCVLALNMYVLFIYVSILMLFIVCVLFV